jgi:hypothetical protein
MFQGPGLAFAGPVRSLQEVRQDGVIIQKWDTSCGAAALATVLTYSLQYPVTETGMRAADDDWRAISNLYTRSIPLPLASGRTTR